MPTDRQLDDRISRWLEAGAPTQLPDRVLRATFERTRKTRQHGGWRALLRRFHISGFVPAVGGAVVVIAAAAVALGLYADQSDVGGPATPTATPDPPDPFVGNWRATDPPIDSSNLTMEVIAQPDGTFAVTIRDDFATVCDGASSTMTGIAEAIEPGTYVIAQPEYVCDDGSEAQALSGPPLEEQLRNYTFVYDASRDVLVEGVVWSRVEVAPSGEEASPTAPAPTVSPTAAPTTAGQATLPPDGARVEPGRYVLEEDGYRYTIEVPTAGWISFEGFAIVRGDERNDPPDMAVLALWGDPKFAFRDPCQWTGTEIDTGRTAEDMAAVLAELEAFSPSAPADVTVSGYSGKLVELAVASDIETSPEGPGLQCQSGEYRSYEGRYYQGAGQVDEVWMLDLEGDRRVVVVSYFPTTSEEVKAELAQMVESMRIEPPDS